MDTLAPVRTPLPRFGRTWMYRAMLNGTYIARERLGADGDARLWVEQVVWPSLPPGGDAQVVVEREELPAGSGTWNAIGEVADPRRTTTFGPLRVVRLPD